LDIINVIEIVIEREQIVILMMRQYENCEQFFRDILDLFYNEF